MELADVETFLVLAEELHFGRTAARLHVSQSRVSKVIAGLERDLGGALFDRTSRSVRITLLGQLFLDGAGPAYGELLASAERARLASRTVAGQLRVGFAPTTGGQALTRFVTAFERGHPQTEVVLVEVPYPEVYQALREGRVDVEVLWRTGAADPDLTEGPTVGRYDRVAVMSAAHPYAGRASVSVHDVDDWVQAEPGSIPEGFLETFLPSVGPGGRPIHRGRSTFRSWSELMALVARGRVTHAGSTSLLEMASRDDIVHVPIRDLPPVELALVWCTAHVNATIRAAVDVAATLVPTEPVG